MVFFDLLFAFLVALILGTVFTVGFRRYGPWSNLVFFLIVFLAAWAGGIWFAPAGPFVWRLYWIPFLVIGLIVALLIAATGPSPSRPSRGSLRQTEETQARETTGARRIFNAAGETFGALGVFFWSLLILLALVIVIRYLWIH